MFSVIISEKGGAERRETFDRTEINVGRVQGNDLMLPKGNVSKRHARLLFRDGRFIVTDLKSTNGTYVNGRKIAQATIVREGDKIYIGDFVLRIDGNGNGASASDPPRPDESSQSSQSIRPPDPGVPTPPPVMRAAEPTPPPQAMRADLSPLPVQRDHTDTDHHTQQRQHQRETHGQPAPQPQPANERHDRPFGRERDRLSAPFSSSRAERGR